jgi:hypothetical protein
VSIVGMVDIVISYSKGSGARTEQFGHDRKSLGTHCRGAMPPHADVTHGKSRPPISRRSLRLPKEAISLRPSAFTKNLKLGFAEIVSLAVLIAM